MQQLLSYLLGFFFCTTLGAMNIGALINNDSMMYPTLWDNPIQFNQIHEGKDEILRFKTLQKSYLQLQNTLESNKWNDSFPSICESIKKIEKLHPYVYFNATTIKIDGYKYTLAKLVHDYNQYKIYYYEKLDHYGTSNDIFYHYMFSIELPAVLKRKKLPSIDSRQYFQYHPATYIEAYLTVYNNTVSTFQHISDLYETQNLTPDTLHEVIKKNNNRVDITDATSLYHHYIYNKYSSLSTMSSQ